MKAIDILTRCRQAPMDIRRIDQRIERRRDALRAIARPPMSSDGGGRGTPDPDKPGKLLGDIQQLEQLRTIREEEYKVELTATCALLDPLPETESSILHCYYAKRQSLFSIARNLRYSDGYIRKVKSEAETRLREVAPEAVVALLPDWYLQKEELNV